MILFEVYIITHMVLFPVNEHWNATHPRLYPMENYVVMNWEKEDFNCFKISKVCYLKEYRDTDNKYKAEARRYWHEHKANRIR